MQGSSLDNSANRDRSYRGDEGLTCRWLGRRVPSLLFLLLERPHARNHKSRNAGVRTLQWRSRRCLSL